MQTYTCPSVTTTIRTRHRPSFFLSSLRGDVAISAETSKWGQCASHIRHRPIFRIFAPHRLHAVYEMRPIATDVACSVVCMSVCWAHRLAVQKRLNRSRCRLGEADLRGSKESCIRWTSRSGNSIRSRELVLRAVVR